MNSRMQIEKAILGACLHCDGYPKIAHILSAKNFTSSPVVRYREVYEAFTALYPSSPIDLITVSNELKKRFPMEAPENITWWILDATNNSVTASSNLISWAFILLQIDITEKYRTALWQWKQVRDKNHEHVESAALLEMMQTANELNDIFEVIEQSIKYFEMSGMEYELTEARELFEHIVDRVRKIKRVDSLHVALRYLFLVTDIANEQVKRECEAFAAAISDMITSGATNERYTEAVNLIYK